MHREQLPKAGDIFERQVTYAGVMQVKITPRRYRSASGQPLNAGGVVFERLEHKLETNPVFDRTTEENDLALERQAEEIPQEENPLVLERPKHHGSQTRQLIPVTGCVPPHIAAQLEKMRDQKGKKPLSRSAVVAELVKKGVQRHVDMQYGATLEPIIERTIERKIDQATSRTANLALEAFFSAEQSRILIIYTLRLLLGSDIDILPQIIKESEEQARLNMKHYSYAEAQEGEQQEEYVQKPQQEVPN